MTKTEKADIIEIKHFLKLGWDITIFHQEGLVIEIRYEPNKEGKLKEVKQ